MPPGEGTGRGTLLIGVDGGASGVRAVAVAVEAGVPSPIGAAEPRAFDDGFAPASLERQRAEQRAPAIEPAERAAGARRIELAAESIAAVAAAHGASRARVGLCWPGAKTADGRGVLVAAHGPRITALASRLEARLVDLGVEPAVPLGPLWSDGWCGTRGERAAEGGALRDVDCGYWLGGGSGLAEGLVLGGAQVALAGELDWFPRAWALTSEAGPSFEELVAPGPVGRRWRGRAAVEAAVHPEDRAERDVEAVAALTNQGTWLARLVFRRLEALRARGATCERAVVAQRLAEVAGDARAEPFLWGTAERELARLLAFEADDELARAWLDRGASADPFPPLVHGRLVRSTLRLAPALGAALAAAEAG